MWSLLLTHVLLFGCAAVCWQRDSYVVTSKHDERATFEVVLKLSVPGSDQEYENLFYAIPREQWGSGPQSPAQIQGALVTREPSAYTAYTIDLVPEENGVDVRLWGIAGDAIADKQHAEGHRRVCYEEEWRGMIGDFKCHLYWRPIQRRHPPPELGR